MDRDDILNLYTENKLPLPEADALQPTDVQFDDIPF
jgi:hypothetical protein